MAVHGTRGFAAEPIRAVETAIESPGARLGAHPGRLLPRQVDLVLKNDTYAKAVAIHDDPRYRALPPAQKQSLEAGWKKIEDGRSKLLSEARALDGESRRLFREGAKSEKAAARLERKREAVNDSIGRWTRGCAEGGWLCRWRGAALDRKARRLERAILTHNARVVRWREKVVGLERRAGQGGEPSVDGAPPDDEGQAAPHD